MHNTIERETVTDHGRGGPEDATAKSGSVERSLVAGCTLFVVGGGCGWEEEIGGAGGEVADDFPVGWPAGCDDLTREEVGVDEWEVVGRGGEESGDGGFAGRDGAGKAEDQHRVGDNRVEFVGGRWSSGDSTDCT